MRTRVNTVTCPECKAEMYSRARHDFRVCGCDFNLMVDGGFDYMRCGGKDLWRIVHKTRYVPLSRKELYDDWNIRQGKFGFIKRDK